MKFLTFWFLLLWLTLSCVAFPQSTTLGPVETSASSWERIAVSIGKVIASNGRSQFEGSCTYLGSGYCMTAWHVVRDDATGQSLPSVVVDFGTDRFAVVQVIKNKQADQAILQLDRQPNVPAIPLSTSPPQRGQRFYGIGYSGRSGLGLTTAILEGYSTKYGGQMETAVHVGESAESGDSGGGLFDSTGAYVGTIWASSVEGQRPEMLAVRWEETRMFLGRCGIIGKLQQCPPGQPCPLPQQTPDQFPQSIYQYPPIQQPPLPPIAPPTQPIEQPNLQTQTIQVPVQIKTVEGPKGEQGPPGKDGSRGPQGERGPEGKPGPPWEPTTSDLKRIASMVSVEIGQNELREIASAVLASLPATPITTRDRDGNVIDLGELRIGQTFEVPPLPGWERSLADLSDDDLTALVSRLPPISLQPGYEDEQGKVKPHTATKPITVRLGQTALLPPNKITVMSPSGTTKTQGPIGGEVRLKLVKPGQE